MIASDELFTKFPPVFFVMISEVDRKFNAARRCSELIWRAIIPREDFT